MGNSNKWMAFGYEASTAGGKVDRSTGFIGGVSVNTEGEALGHGVWLDESFIDAVVEGGNEKKQGVKARFGHPNMCSTALGTFVGRFKNFRKQQTVRDDGSKAWQAVADLFVSNSARETPNGDLYAYIFDMAESEADAFGTSIVFEPGQTYFKAANGLRVYESGTGDYVDEGGNRIDEESIDFTKPFATLSALHGCDLVDTPAANDGLFSRFSQETIAGQITEFFNLHPQILTALTENPEVMSAIANNGHHIDEFITRYTAHKAKGDKEMSENANPEMEELSPPVVVDREGIEVVEEKDNKEDAPPAEVTGGEGNEENLEPAAEIAEETAESVEEQPASAETAVEEETKEDERAAAVSEFSRMVEAFGVDIASAVFSSGGNYEDAKDLAIKQLREENETLRAKVAEQKGGSPAHVSHEAREKSSLFKVK